MNKYIALLRGINVSGQKKILMVDLKALFESIGFKEVRTYIQSGNVVFLAEEASNLADAISSAIFKKYGWDVPVLVRTAAEIKDILSNCPFSEEKKEKSYFTLFQQRPTEENIQEIANLSFPGEEFQITPTCLYYFCATGYGRVKMRNNLIERKLKVRATTRNYRTLLKLTQLGS
ncbi:MAG: DUF1697 domain-containing protein [Bacteroidota bacterium]